MVGLRQVWFRYERTRVAGKMCEGQSLDIKECAQNIKHNPDPTAAPIIAPFKPPSIPPDVAPITS